MVCFFTGVLLYYVLIHSSSEERVIVRSKLAPCCLAPILHFFIPVHFKPQSWAKSPGNASRPVGQTQTTYPAQLPAQLVALETVFSHRLLITSPCVTFLLCNQMGGGKKGLVTCCQAPAVLFFFAQCAQVDKGECSLGVWSVKMLTCWEPRCVKC